MGQIWKRAVTLRVENIDSGQAREFTALQVEFDIARTLEKEPSTLRATVYNLSLDSRSWLESGDRLVVTLSAGYSGELHDLFVGDLRIARHRRDGANIATDIEAGDGEKGARKWARKWFPKNSRLEDIFAYLIRKAQLGEGNFREALSVSEENGVPDTIKAGMHVRGYALDELRELANSRGIEVSVQSNEVQMTAFSAGVVGIPVTKLNPGNGLIGAPTIDNEGFLSADLRLRPFVFPGSIVEVESEFVTGRFKVVRANYTGSVWGEDFNINIEAKEL